MTWYAAEILAEPRPELFQRLSASPLLLGHLYLLKGECNYEFYSSEVAHSFPELGILVASHFSEPGTHCESWFEEDFISWYEFSFPASLSLSSLINKLKEIETIDTDDFPPETFLGYVEALSRECKAIIGFYNCFMWGGDIESEVTYLFLPNQEPSALITKHGIGHTVVTPTGITNIKGKDALQSTLEYLGLELEHPFFAPHTRSFNWSPYACHKIT